jgi:hypothetical protein
LEGACDLDRMAEIMQDLMELAIHDEWDQVPEAFVRDMEKIIYAGRHLRSMTAAVKAEYYSEHCPGSNLKLVR